MVARHHGMLVPIEAFLEHLGGCRRAVQHALNKEVNIPLEYLQLA